MAKIKIKVEFEMEAPGYDSAALWGERFSLSIPTYDIRLRLEKAKPDGGNQEILIPITVPLYEITGVTASERNLDDNVKGYTNYSRFGREDE